MPAEQTLTMLDSLARIVTMDVIHAATTGVVYAVFFVVSYFAIRLLDR